MRGSGRYENWKQDNNAERVCFSNEYFCRMWNIRKN